MTNENLKNLKTITIRVRPEVLKIIEKAADESGYHALRHFYLDAFVEKIRKLGMEDYADEMESLMREGKVDTRNITLDDEHYFEVPKNVKGLIRNIDALGRLVIPREIMKDLGIKQQDPVEITVMSARGGTVCVNKVVNRCVFCGTENDIIKHGDRCICESCYEEFAAATSSEKNYQ